VTNIARVKSVSVLQGADRVQNRAQGPGSRRVGRDRARQDLPDLPAGASMIAQPPMTVTLCHTGFLTCWNTWQKPRAT